MHLPEASCVTSAVILARRGGWFSAIGAPPAHESPAGLLRPCTNMAHRARLLRLREHLAPPADHPTPRTVLSTPTAAADWGDDIDWNAKGKGGAVAAGGAGAVAAGRSLLSQGGNAAGAIHPTPPNSVISPGPLSLRADAAAATLLALAITDYGNTSIGGEIPLLIYDADLGQVSLANPPTPPQAVPRSAARFRS